MILLHVYGVTRFCYIKMCVITRVGTRKHNTDANQGANQIFDLFDSTMKNFINVHALRRKKTNQFQKRQLNQRKVSGFRKSKSEDGFSSTNDLLTYGARSKTHKVVADYSLKSILSPLAEDEPGISPNTLTVSSRLLLKLISYYRQHSQVFGVFTRLRRPS